MKRPAFEQELLPIGCATPSEVFARTRNYLAGRHLGATRDAALLDQVLLCLFAKLHLSQEVHQRRDQDAEALKRSYVAALTALARRLGSESLPRARLTLDADGLRFVDRMLSLLDLSSRSGDLVGDAYQCFLGSEMRGQEGQFFTPVTAVDALIEVVAPKPDERVIDPACGAGGFLFATARRLLELGVHPSRIQESVFGIDKDAHLARLARMRVSLLTLRETNVTVGDSLAWQSAQRSSFMHAMRPGEYDVVLTNPPFGSKIVSASDELRKRFTLAHRWVLSTSDGRLTSSTELQPSTPPQVLFIERCVELVRPGGRIGIVVPESLISGRNYRHVVEFIGQHTSVEAVIGMPEALFKTSGKGGTHTKTALLYLRKRSRAKPSPDHQIFMAEATWCGHDSRGRRIPKNDIPAILRNYRGSRGNTAHYIPSSLGYTLRPSDITDSVLAPRAYDPEIRSELASMNNTHLLVRFGELVENKILSLATGDEVGKLVYGSGNIPFVRTSDLSNWELKIEPKHGINRDIYDSLRRKQDVQPGDILMVRDGTYLIGTCAIVTKYDVEIVFQSHLYKIRVNPNDLLDPFLLLAVLSSSIVQRQIRILCRTMDIIDSLGSRVLDIVLPIPRKVERREEISHLVGKVIEDRVKARELTRDIIENVSAADT